MLNPKQNIVDRLAAADRLHQKEAGGVLLLRSVKYALGAVLAVFLLDVIFHLVAGVRLGLGLLIVCGGIALLGCCWYVAYVRRNRLEHIARFLETRDAALGSRLINMLQLDEQARDGALPPLTRTLAEQAVEGYSAQLGAVEIEKLARTDALGRQWKRAAWALLGFAAVFAICFRITEVEVLRFADPYGDHPPYSFTTLEIVAPGIAGTTVLYGKGLTVKVKAMGHQPAEVDLTSYPPGHPEQAVTVPMFGEGGTGFNQIIDNVRTELIVYAHTKDGVSESKKVRVGLVLTPQLEKAYLRVTAPAYTGIQPDEKVYDYKGVQALEGSEVRFRLQSNRPLRDGVIEIAEGDQAPQRVMLKKTGENEVTGSFIARDSGRIRLGIADVAGTPAQGNFESGLTVTHDLPPEVRMANPGHDAVVAQDFKLQTEIDASDDYGLREIRFHRGLNGVYSPPQVNQYHAVVLDSRETADFDLNGLGIHPGDVISLFAEAVDNAPQPHITRSQTVRLQIISVEDYNNYLREQTDVSDTEAKYSQMNDDLQELIDKQKELGAAADALKEQIAKSGDKDKGALAQQLDSLMAQQSELNQKLNQQAGRMENFVRQHPVYDVEKDMQQELKEQAAAIRQSTQADQDAANQVAQQSSQGGRRQLTPEMMEAFKKASDSQVAKLEQTHQETAQQVVKPLQDMSQMQELQKDFSQFEALYQKQQELTQQAQAYNRPGELQREDQLALKDLAATQDDVGDALDQLKDKLRDDAQAAEKNFPKAAQSGRSLAEQIEGGRLAPLAGQATSQMLAGDGEQSFALADRLRAEMEKLMGECHGGNCPNPDELDSYLRPMRLSPGSSFAQMARSHKFGRNLGKTGSSGKGEGTGGESGYAAMDGSDMEVMGNESELQKSTALSHQASPLGKGHTAADGGKGRLEKPDSMKGVNAGNRQSGANTSETVIEQYNDVVENYFKAITTKKGKTSQ